MIELKNICKEYHSGGAVKALKDVNLKIRPGEFVAVMGASGSGKTTLLNIIGCMDRPTSGEYFLGGCKVDTASAGRTARIRGKKIAFVFQYFALIEDYTVLENVMISLLKQKIPQKDRVKRALKALEQVGIADLARKKAADISGGQKQRAAIARATACRAEIILADEPTGALDSESGRQVMDLFCRLNKQGKTIMLITHDANIAAFAHRVITISDGRIIKDEKN